MSTYDLLLGILHKRYYIKNKQFSSNNLMEYLRSNHNNLFISKTDKSGKNYEAPNQQVMHALYHLEKEGILEQVPFSVESKLNKDILISKIYPSFSSLINFLKEMESKKRRGKR